MPPLSPTLHTEFSRRLQQQRDEALGIVRSRSNDSAQAASASDGTAPEEQESTPLHEIDAAIARLEAGNYGQCSRCGGAIDEARLRAQPSLQHCATCQP